LKRTLETEIGTSFKIGLLNILERLSEMSKRLSISVVTPSFNQASFIHEALESVSIQNYPNYEHLVIDGLSTDGTIEVLQNFDAVKVSSGVTWVSERDNGQSEALNKGFRQATGDIIGWLNADDRYREGCFEHVAKMFEENPGIDILYGDYCVVDEAGGLIRIKPEIAFNAFVLFYHRVLYIPTAATFFRRRVFDEGNWINEKLQYVMDLEFFIRLAVEGYQFEHIPKLLADFRLQPASKTCRYPQRQQCEHRQVVFATVPLLSRLKSEWLKKLVLLFFRPLAGLRRYGEKVIHGSYLTQLNVYHVDRF
jgi:glycosyltransferase involved in cell wall biosynthesis